MIALVFCGDLKYCPYIKRYVERLEKNDVKYDVIFWNRSNSKLTLPENYIYYSKESKLSKSKFLKLYDFILFKNWLNKLILKNNYEKIIVLSTLTGIIIYNTLMKKKTNYIFDIRDYSYEHIKIFYKMEKKLINRSQFTSISSKGFKNFLPDYDYVIAHNFNRNEIKKEYFFKKKKGTINIVWNGVIRYFDYQKQYLDIFKNDERFKLIFHGDGPELYLFKEYCERQQITNVEFTGEYNNDEKYALLKDADILNNCYGKLNNNSNETLYALSNKYYDGLVYRIPQLVETSGYKAKLVSSERIGLAPQISKNLANEVFEYYNLIDEDDFNNKCEKILKDVLKEDDIYINKIDNFIRGVEK